MLREHQEAKTEKSVLLVAVYKTDPTGNMDLQGNPQLQPIQVAGCRWALTSQTTLTNMFNFVS